MLIADIANMKGLYHDHKIVLHIPWILRKDQSNIYINILTYLVHIVNICATLTVMTVLQ